jgi:hydrogenase maturation protein HypF
MTKQASGVLRVDWQPLLCLLLDSSQSAAARAEAFHASLARTLLDQALEIRSQTRVSLVGLGGGVFQNRMLTELVVSSLRQEGFEVVLPERLPVNDASISYGQIIEASAVAMRAKMPAPGDSLVSVV